MDIYCHIGMPKAGSSSLQHILGKNRQALLGAGIYYPPSIFAGTEYVNTQLNNVWKDGKVGLAPYVRAATNKGCDKIILSSEFMYLNLDEYPDYLARKIRRYCQNNHIRLHIICVTRPPQSFLKSLYKQQVLNRIDIIEDFDTFHKAQPQARKNIAHPFLWLNTFLSELMPHSVLMLNLGPDFISAVSKLIEFDLETDEDLLKPQNQSLPDVYTEIWRQLNSQAPPGQEMANFAQAVISLTGSNSEVLLRKARQLKTPPQAIDPKRLAAFSYISNPPLIYNEPDFEAAILSLQGFPNLPVV